MATLLATSACSGDKVTSPFPSQELLPNNTEINILKNLLLAFEYKSPEAYEAGFDTSHFSFRFEGKESVGDPYMPSSWNWEQDFASVRNLFENPAVSEIKLDFDIGAPSLVPETGTYPQDWTRVSVSGFELEIRSGNSVGGESVVHKVSGGQAIFVFKPYPDELVDGLPRLRIEEWVDLGSSSPAEALTWGAVKTLYQERPWLPNTTASNLLTNLITAYQMRNVDAYAELFDAEQFTFVFDATDVEDDPYIDIYWGWPEEFRSTKRMLGSRLVLDIKVEFVPGPLIAAVESDGVPLSWTKVIATNVTLDIDTIDPRGGENIIYKVVGDRETFFFKDYPGELIDGQPRQRIVEWRDEKIGLVLPTLTTSWGRIKNLWR